jgi:F-type H+-transporting ATPase subunit epsilon
MNSIALEIITPQRKAFTENVNAVFVPTANGRVGVLPRHIGLFTALTEGEVKITYGGKDWFLAIGGGFMEVTKEKISILVSRAVHADEINEAELKKAEKDARDIISQKGKTEERTVALASLRRSFLELKVLRHHRHRQTPSIS